ncbi:branched-chain amino acid aminotransferase [Podospora didyma]|uniref:Branched-chain amino acid aminotransferase n=1 Tax=Podospora didyma TaxID=330526 RepID=A0AAE0U0K3_9PEZI|nr:branched-chain amino acid aminotransferase [Podospora didyma]
MSQPFPPPPTTALDWENAEELFKFQEVNGHIESTHHKSTGQWTPLKFIPDPFMRIHGLAPGLNYGQQAFEGLKAFRMPDNNKIAIFRPDRNAQRLQHSARTLNMPAVPTDMFIRACRAAAALNAEFVPPHETGWSLYCRPLMFASGPMFPPGLPNEVTFAVYVFPTPTSHRADANPDPVKALVLDEFDRAAPRGTGTAKAGGNYAGVFRHAGSAQADGFGITLHLDSVRHEYVDEFSLCGFLGVIRSSSGGGDDEDNVTLVVPESPCAIDSLTSDSVQQIARSWGWKVVKRLVPYTELPAFSEVLGAGTAMGLVPIRSITRRLGAGRGRLPVGHPRVATTDNESEEAVVYIADEQKGGGPVFRKLMEKFKAIQLGKGEDEFGWRFEVQEKDKQIARL